MTVEDDQGWVPASFLRKLSTTNQDYQKIEPAAIDGNVMTPKKNFFNLFVINIVTEIKTAFLLLRLVKNELYVGTEDIEPENKDEIKLSKGAPVEVLKKSETGWWLVK